MTRTPKTFPMDFYHDQQFGHQENEACGDLSMQNMFSMFKICLTQTVLLYTHTQAFTILMLTKYHSKHDYHLMLP